MGRFKKSIGNFFSFLGKQEYSLKKHENFIENFYNTNFNKNALLCYLVDPFVNPDHFFYHTNRLESKALGDVLNSLEFNVDVVNFDTFHFDFKKKYDLLIGFGQPFEEVLLKHDKTFRLILYRNGTEQGFTEDISLKKMQHFYSKYGKILPESVPIYPFCLRTQVAFADKVITLGNKWVSETYKDLNNNTVNLNLMFHDVGSIDLERKDFENSKNNFIWFGSNGAIRKGLDLTLEYFKKNPEKNLYVCGLSESEFRFKGLFDEYLSLPNVKNLGFIKMESIEFLELMNKCCAAIFPTCWEAGGGAMLNLIACAGLIPIVPENIGLDFKNHEIFIEDIFEDNCIQKAIAQYDTLTTEEIKRKSYLLRQYIRENHSISGFSSNLKSILV
jgi:hypothetical protein